MLHAPPVPPSHEKCGPHPQGTGREDLFQYVGPHGEPGPFQKNQMVGVFNLELARMYGYLYQNTDKKFTILNALDGYDEISLTGDTKTISNHTEAMLTPADFGVEKVSQQEITGGGRCGRVGTNIYEHSAGQRHRCAEQCGLCQCRGRYCHCKGHHPERRL